VAIVGTRTSTDQVKGSTSAAPSRYERGWTTVTILAATGWIALGVSQSRLLPLLGLVAMLGAYAGVLTTRASVLTTRGRAQYVAGAASAAALVLVLVGMRHHPAAGLAMTAVLGAASPHLLRWVADGEVHLPWLHRSQHADAALIGPRPESRTTTRRCRPTE
jgi:hypothetical protein